MLSFHTCAFLCELKQSKQGNGMWAKKEAHVGDLERVSSRKKEEKILR